MTSVILVDGPAAGQVVYVSETTRTYRTEKPRPLSLFPASPSDDLLDAVSLFETVDYHIELAWLLLEDGPERRACPVRFGWSVRNPTAWELGRMIDPDLLWVIRQRADGAVTITPERAEEIREGSKPPVHDRHDVDWCRESPGDYACIDGAQYGPCGHPNCYGACEWQGDCPCKCHIPERLRTGRPIWLRARSGC